VLVDFSNFNLTITVVLHMLLQVLVLLTIPTVNEIYFGVLVLPV
jgi:hypothetical protein